MKDLFKGIVLILALATLAYLVMYAYGVQKQIKGVRQEIELLKNK